MHTKVGNYVSATNKVANPGINDINDNSVSRQYEHEVDII